MAKNVKRFDKLKKSEIGIGYKVFNSDWTCNNFQYEVGKEYIHNGDIELCSYGFHFCPNLIDCFNYYSWDSSNKVAIIHYEISKTLMPDGSDKFVTSHIRIEKEIYWEDVMKICNSGKFNSGYRNSGDGNSGHRNSGYGNSGDGNSGYRNSGHRNSGYGNSGDGNSGYGNSGDGNSGHGNSGHRNSGDGNSGDGNSGHGNSGYGNSGHRNSGVFNTDEPYLRIFNTDTNLKFEDIYTTLWFKSLQRLSLNNFIFYMEMTLKEKKNHPEAEVLGGYLKTLSYKEAWKVLWKNLSKEEKNSFKTIPNFDKNLFKEITGITIK